jgi:hypothetical protein
MRGGILWRLAREILGDDVVTAGPTSPSPHHDSFVLITEDGQHFYDDNMLEIEDFLVCGVYRVATGRGKQTTDKSWFPKPSVWASSGLNFGFWSNTCEDWFQARVRTIQAGTAELRTSAEWRNTLMRYRYTKTFVEANEKLSAGFIAGARYM